MEDDTTLEAHFDELQPIERLMVVVAPLQILAESILRAAQSGQAHPYGVYQKAESVIITNGKGGKIRLVEVQLPVQVVEEILSAYADCLETQMGIDLEAKIEVMRASVRHQQEIADAGREN